MTQLETAMAILISTFKTYAAGEGKLNKKEAKELLEKELPALFKEAKNPGEVEELLKGLDENRDEELDFLEFMRLVTTLTCACHDLLSKE